MWANGLMHEFLTQTSEYDENKQNEYICKGDKLDNEL